MANPQLTVLMTVYNAGSYLDEAILSILGQSFENYEFLIIDDASTDGTTDRLKDWVKRDARIRLICGDKNSGQTACLNRGLGEARGQWIARQDADDISEKSRLGRQIRRMENEPELILIGCNGWVMDAVGRPNGTINVPCKDGAIRWAMPIQNPFIHSGVMFRRGEFYDEGFGICQDWELWTRLIQKGKVANLAERLLFYRHHETSLSHARTEQTETECERIVGRTGEDAVWLAAFRRGLKPEERKPFWKWYTTGLKQSPYRKEAHEAVALHHLQTAGVLWSVDRIAALAEIISAAEADASHVCRFFADRLRMPKISR